MLKSIFLFTFLGFFQFSASAQDQIPAQTLNSDWKLLTKSNGLLFFVQQSPCNVTPEGLPSDYVFVRILNTNNSDMKADFSLSLLFKEGCIGCTDSPDTHSSITIPAGATVEGNCEQFSKGLYQLIRNNNLKGGWLFTGVTISGLKITKI